LVVEEVQEDVGSALVRSSDSEIIDLAFEQNPFTVDNPGVETRFVDRRGETEIP
jgi:hypothetical protein